jgi:hypothetical protein
MIAPGGRVLNGCTAMASTKRGRLRLYDEAPDGGLHQQPKVTLPTNACEGSGNALANSARHGRALSEGGTRQHALDTVPRNRLVRPLTTRSSPVRAVCGAKCLVIVTC